MNRGEERRVQINFRPSASLLEDLNRYKEEMGYRSLPQTVYFLVCEAVDNKLRDRGLK